MNNVTRATARKRTSQLRLEGYGYTDICEIVTAELGLTPGEYTPRMVSNDISNALALAEKELRETAAEVAWIELDRFDVMLSKVWDKVLDGDLAAVSKALEISRERRKLLGIDKDTLKVDWRIELADLMDSGKLRPEEIVTEFGEEVLAEINQLREGRDD